MGADPLGWALSNPLHLLVTLLCTLAWTAVLVGYVSRAWHRRR